MGVFKYQMIHRHNSHNNCDHNYSKVSDTSKTLLHNHRKEYKQTTELPITFLLKESHLPHNSYCNQYVKTADSMVCR